MRNSARSHAGLASGKLAATAQSKNDNWSRRVSDDLTSWIARQPRGLVVVVLAALSWGILALALRGAAALVS